MQETQNRTIQHDLSSLPTRIRVVGYTYLVDFGPSTQPRFHTVDKQQRCSCELGAVCPAIEAVAGYLRSGGQRAIVNWAVEVPKICGINIRFPDVVILGVFDWFPGSGQRG